MIIQQVSFSNFILFIWANFIFWLFCLNRFHKGADFQFLTSYKIKLTPYCFIKEKYKVNFMILRIPRTKYYNRHVIYFYQWSPLGVTLSLYTYWCYVIPMLFQDIEAYLSKEPINYISITACRVPRRACFIQI
jgi:hypothetical protein